MTAERQSGRQSGARSQHHLGVSLPLARRHFISIIPVGPNNLNPVSTFWGEDQWSPHPVRPRLLLTSSFTCPKSRAQYPEAERIAERFQARGFMVEIIYVIHAKLQSLTPGPDQTGKQLNSTPMYYICYYIRRRRNGCQI